MKIDIETANNIWDKFLTAWPLERVKAMSLSEYSNVGNKDIFIYWIEKRLDQMGSIWGGSSFKFGVYERADLKEKEGGKTRSYDSQYAWYTKYGESAEKAFINIRKLIVTVIEAAQKGDFEAIDAVDLGDAYKWKIAFHYQDRINPKIVNIFKKEALVYFLNYALATDKPFSYLYSQVIAEKPEGKSILGYGDEIWDHWIKRLKIWKISHGNKDFAHDERVELLHKNLAVVHSETAKGQGAAFSKEMHKNDIFYLCHGNYIQLIGKIKSDAEPYDKGDGWLQRGYTIIKKCGGDTPYNDIQKGWTPNYNSTCKLVRSEELLLFENMILKPYFNLTLSELASIGEGKDNSFSEEDETISLRSSGDYLPNKDDFESAYRMLCTPGQPIAKDSILDQVEKNAINSGHNLKEQWRLITGNNIEIWVKGK